jgi:hypothetical protein
MKTLAIAILFLLTSCAANNTAPLETPRPDTVIVDGQRATVAGWVDFRGIDVPYSEVGRAPAFTLTLPHLRYPLLTADVLAKLAGMGFTINSELARQRMIELIVTETGL